MASVAPQPHPPAGIHSAMTASPSPTSSPQPPSASVAGPRSLSALTIPPPPPPTRTPPSVSASNAQQYIGPSPYSSTTTSSASSSTTKATSPNPPLKPVYRSMLDIGPLAAPNKKDSKDSYSSGSVSPSRSEASSAEISRNYSSENNAHQMEFGEFSLSPVQTSSTSAMDSEDVGSDAPPHGVNQANGLARATTSPSLLTMASPARPQRPPPAPLSRNTNSYIASTKRLPDLPPPSPATPSTSKATDKQQPPQKQGFFKRVESFINKKNGNTYITPNGDRQSDSASQTSQTQKSKGTFSVSSQSPMALPSGSPPSPRSRESTVVDYELAPDQQGPDTATFGHGHSASANSMARMAEQPRAGTPRMGITWGPNYVEDADSMTPYPVKQRRRSVSQDNLGFGHKKKDRDSDAPVELMATFSFRSAEGVGMKSRRLSTALPDEFHVDCCELSNEFSAAGSNPFVRGKTVGKGATAIVKLMYKKGDSSKALYAAKEFRRKDKAEDETEYVKKVKSEYTIANSVHHPNIVRTVRLCTNHSKWNHVMEYCSYGELYHWIEKGVFRRGIWSVSDRQCLFKQLIRGVDYLHSHGIAHRDIKLENLLLNQDGHLKITDFGVSDVFSGEHPGLRTSGGQCGKNMGTVRRSAPGICGSLPYIAPEVLEKNGDYDPRPYDVWSCAIVYMVMLHGGNPWSEARPVDRFYKQFIDAWNEWFETHPDGEIKDEVDGTPKVKGAFHSKFFQTASMRRLILKMLHPDPDKRPTMHDVLYSREVKSIEICTPEACDEHGNEIYEELTDCTSKAFKKAGVRKKHGHIPPKEHKTPVFLQHRFDMGDGYR